MWRTYCDRGGGGGGDLLLRCDQNSFGRTRGAVRIEWMEAPQCGACAYTAFMNAREGREEGGILFLSDARLGPHCDIIKVS